MSITVLNYLDQTLVNSITEQAAVRARAAAAAVDTNKDFSTVLDEASQTLASENDTSSNTSAAVVSPQATTASYSSDELETIFEDAANTYGVSSNLLKSIAKAESGFNASAISSAGAIGIMQLMPATAASLGVTNSYDAKENIMGGAKYISQLLSQYSGNISLALAAYNAGSANVDKYGGIPPFTETQTYVQKVLSYMNGAVSVASSATSASSIFGLTGSDRAEANQMLESFFTSKNISKEALDLLALLLKVKGSSSTSTANTDSATPSSNAIYAEETPSAEDEQIPVSYMDVPLALPLENPDGDS